MPPRSRLSIAKSDIVSAIDALPQRVLTRRDLDELLARHRTFWRISQSTTTQKFIDFLIANSELKPHRFALPHRPTIRYEWREATTLEIIQSLRPDGYFSHFTAIHLHGMTQQAPKTVYLNSEQRLESGGGTLTQAGIDRAFRGRCRVSSNQTDFRGTTVCILNGANTGQLGVIDFESDLGRGLRVSNIERTLIDITVRPIYSGGVAEVAEAYESAHGRFSVNRLAAYLRQLSFTYPYHQAIGYYLERSGKYAPAQLDLLRQFPINFDFYLTYQMKQMDYVPEWRLFVPKGF